MIERMTVYFIVATVNGQDRRTGQAHATRAEAQSWVSLVRKCWWGHAQRVRVLACRLRWVDGRLDAASIQRLDWFHMDPPDHASE